MAAGKSDSVTTGDNRGCGEKESSCLEDLFRKWLEMKIKRTSYQESDAFPCQVDDHRRLAQEVLMSTAACVRSRTLGDLVFKLAFWRWSTDDIGPSLDEMNSTNAIIYSVFRDLAEMTGEMTVQTDLDKRTRFLRDILAD